MHPNGETGYGRQGLRLLVLFVLALGLLAVSPHPVQAVCCEDGAAGKETKNAESASWWSAVLGVLGNIVTMASTVVDNFKEYMEDFEQTIVEFNDNYIAGKEIQTLITRRNFQGLGEAILHYQADEATIKASLTGAPPRFKDADGKPMNLHGCYVRSLRQAPVVAAGAEKKMAKNYAAWINSLYRERYDGERRLESGMGPMYAADDRAMRCAMKTGNPMRGDDPKCTDTDARLWDAEISAATLNGPVLEMPPMVKKIELETGKPIDVPDPKTVEQRLWVAAMNYCVKVMGPRPNVPFGKELMTPTGMVAGAQANQCLAIQSAFIRQCVNRVAKRTRPNCSGATDATVKAACAAAHNACKKAKLAKFALPKEFEGCDSDNGPGLSPYQLEYLSNTVCFSPQKGIDGIGMGASHGELVAQSDQCQLLLTTWKTQLAKEDAAFLAAVKGAMKMGRCWNKINQVSPLKVVKTPEVEKPAVLEKLKKNVSATSEESKEVSTEDVETLF